MSKKKILIFSPYYSPEPVVIGTFTEELVSRSDVNQVTVITSLPNYRNYKFYDGFNFFGPYIEKKNKFKIIRLPVIPRFSNSKLAIFSFYLSFFTSSFVFFIFFALLNRNKYDHLITYCGSPVYIGYIGFIASKILNTNSSQWVQDIWPEAIETTVGIKNKLIRKIIYKLQNYMWKCTDHIFTESSDLAEYIKSKIKNKKVTTLFNPIENEFSELSNKNYENKKFIEFSYIGNIGKAQNVELIIESFLQSGLNGVKLNICGDGSLHKELSNKYNNKNIKWHGWLSGNNLADVYHNSDFLILSLNSKGRQNLIIPSKIQSYFMHRKPILCISDGAVGKLINSTSSGLVCNKYNVKDVSKMYEDAVKLSIFERDQMSSNAYKFFLDNFTKEKVVNKFLNSI